MAEFSAEFIGMEHAAADIKSIVVQLKNYALSIEQLTKALSMDIKSVEGIQSSLWNISSGVMEQSEILSSMAGAISMCADEYNIHEKEICTNSGGGSGGGYSLRTPADTVKPSVFTQEITEKGPGDKIEFREEVSGAVTPEVSSNGEDSYTSTPVQPSDYTPFDSGAEELTAAKVAGRSAIAFTLAGAAAAAAVFGADKLSKASDGRGIDEKTADKIIEFAGSVSGKAGDLHE